MSKTQQIVSLEVENFKRVKAVRLVPNAGVTTVSGRNGQGKSSTLDAIEAALGGKDAAPSKPIRRGAESSRIVLETTDYIVVRTFKGETSKLEVKSKDGAKFSSPQAILDALLGDLSFDPLDFTRRSPKEQAELLRKLAGLDFTSLDASRAQTFENRTEVNREVKRLDGELSGVAFHADAPSAEVSSADLVAELNRANAAHAEVQSAFARADAGHAEAKRLRGRASDGTAQIDRLRQEIEDRLAKVAEYEAAVVCLADEAKAQEGAADAISDEATSATTLLPDVSEIEARIAGADAINAKVRENARHADVTAKLAAAKAKADEMTARLARIDAEKAEALASASFPLAGLSIDADGATLNGLPFEQASQAEQLRASISIGAALHPRLRVVLVRQGAFLDDDALALVAKVAEEQRLQVIVERVGKGDSMGVTIEDGEILAAEVEAAE